MSIVNKVCMSKEKVTMASMQKLESAMTMAMREISVTRKTEVTKAMMEVTATKARGDILQAIKETAIKQSAETVSKPVGRARTKAEDESAGRLMASKVGRRLWISATQGGARKHSAMQRGVGLERD